MRVLALLQRSTTERGLRDLLSHSRGGWKSQVKAPAEPELALAASGAQPLPAGGSLTPLHVVFPLCLLTPSLLCVFCALSEFPPFYGDTSPRGPGPALMTSPSRDPLQRPSFQIRPHSRVPGSQSLTSTFRERHNSACKPRLCLNPWRGKCCHSGGFQ